MKIGIIVCNYKEKQGVNSVVDQYLKNQKEFLEKGITITGVYDRDAFYTVIPERKGTIEQSSSKEKLFSKLKKSLFYKTRLGQALTVFIRFFLESKKTAKKYVQLNNKEDYVISQDALVSFYLIKRGFKNVIYMTHSFDKLTKNLEINYPKIEKTFIYRILNKRINYAIKNSKAIITICETARKMILKNYKNNNVYKIYNALAINAPTEDRKQALQNRIRIVSASHLSFVKGIDLLIEAISKNYREWENKVEFYLFGDGVYMDDLKRLKESLKVDNIYLVGNQPEPYKQYVDKDVYLSTSRLDTMPMGIIEAMAMALPIVATNVGAVSEMIDDGVNGCLISPNASSIESGINWIINHKENMCSLGKESRRIYEERFSTTIWVDNMSEILMGLK